ncbi:hypothetical protein QF026_005891 [Streptomyces aurantiacus]|nr:hypothetical protein [Streptomyces aurantiacus]
MADTHHEEVLDRIAKGLVYTESEAAFQAPRRRTDQIFEYNRTIANRPREEGAPDVGTFP